MLFFFILISVVIGLGILPALTAGLKEYRCDYSASHFLWVVSEQWSDSKRFVVAFTTEDEALAWIKNNKSSARHRAYREAPSQATSPHAPSEKRI